MYLTFELAPYRVNKNYHAKDPGQRLFHPKAIVQTYTEATAIV